MGNLIFTLLRTLFTALPNTTGTSQGQSKKSGSCSKKLNKVITGHSDFAPKKVRGGGGGVGESRLHGKLCINGHTAAFNR